MSLTVSQPVIPLHYLICYGELNAELDNSYLFGLLHDMLIDNTIKCYLHTISKILDKKKIYDDILITSTLKEDNHPEAKKIYRFLSHIHNFTDYSVLIIPVTNYTEAMGYIKEIYENEIFSIFEVTNKESPEEEDDVNNEEEEEEEEENEEEYPIYPVTTFKNITYNNTIWYTLLCEI